MSIAPRDDPIQESGIAGVTDEQLGRVLGQDRNVLGVAGVGELVGRSHVHAGMVVDDVVHEVIADEAEPPVAMMLVSSKASAIISSSKKTNPH